MPDILVRNVPAETKQRLAARAKAHGRSLQAEALATLKESLEANPPQGLGTLLTSIGQEIDGVELDIRRSRETYRPIDLS